MSLSKIFAGRKKECEVWKYFEHIASNNTSKCLVEDDKGKECGAVMSGKNPSNLKKHIQSHHAAAFRELAASEESRVAGKRKASGDDAAKPTKCGNQTIGQCLARKVVFWESTSQEHVRRQEDLVSAIVDTGYPTTMVNNAKIRAFCSSLDPKFKLPGRTCIT